MILNELSNNGKIIDQMVSRKCRILILTTNEATIPPEKIIGINII